MEHESMNYKNSALLGLVNLIAFPNLLLFRRCHPIKLQEQTISLSLKVGVQQYILEWNFSKFLKKSVH